LFVKAISDFH